MKMYEKSMPSINIRTKRAQLNPNLKTQVQWYYVIIQNKAITSIEIVRFIRRVMGLQEHEQELNLSLKDPFFRWLQLC